MKLGILEAEEVEAKDIFTVRTLSAEEQHTFADHVRAQHANYGWYLVPNAVDTEGGDGVDRLKYYRHFSSVAVDGIAALNSATWRRKQLRDLFIQLVEEVVAPKIQSVETKAAVKAAAGNTGVGAGGGGGGRVRNAEADVGGRDARLGGEGGNERAVPRREGDRLVSVELTVGVGIGIGVGARVTVWGNG